jgi:hypothetical protein
VTHVTSFPSILMSNTNGVSNLTCGGSMWITFFKFGDINENVVVVQG